MASPPLSAHVVAGVDQHAARARARVVDGHALLWIHEAYHELDNWAGRVELASLLAGRVGEVSDQVLVGRTEQVRKLEVLVAQPILREVVDEVPPLAIRHLRGADPPVEVDVLQHPFQSPIAVLECRERLVQPVAHLMVHLVPQVRPASLRRHEERLLVEVGITGSQLSVLLRAPPPDLGLHHPPTLLLEHIARPL